MGVARRGAVPPASETTSMTMPYLRETGGSRGASEDKEAMLPAGALSSQKPQVSVRNYRRIAISKND
jgi:hypothetical protein